MAEGVGNGNGAVGVEAGLTRNGVGRGDRAVSWVAPIAVFFAAPEHVFQCLVNQWACIKRDRCTKEAEGGLNDGQSAPSARVWVIDAAGTHVK